MLQDTRWDVLGAGKAEPSPLELICFQTDPQGKNEAATQWQALQVPNEIRILCWVVYICLGWGLPVQEDSDIQSCLQDWLKYILVIYCQWLFLL